MIVFAFFRFQHLQTLFVPTPSTTSHCFFYYTSPVSCYEMIAKIFSSRGSLRSLHFAAKRSFATKSNDHYAISQLLQQVEKGSISANEAEKAMRDLAELNAKGKAPDETLRSFANLDHRRSSRTGFPEVCVCGYFEEKCCTFIVSHPSNCMFQIDR